jgi:hypothetical protein
MFHYFFLMDFYTVFLFLVEQTMGELLQEYKRIHENQRGVSSYPILRFVL